MDDVSATISPPLGPGAQIRDWRTREKKISLDDLADLLKDAGAERPSTAKLSRIETGIQPVSLDILDALVLVTHIPAASLRPDLAALMQGAAE